MVSGQEYKERDQFYTTHTIAQRCINHFNQLLKNNCIDAAKYWFIEPSCGKGVFYNLLPNDRRTGIDLYPAMEGTIQQDYLNFKPEKDKKYIVIGNPPFGGGELALKFVNYSAGFADYCALILPPEFAFPGQENKVCYKVSPEYRIIHNEELEGRNNYRTPTGGTAGIGGTHFIVYTKILKGLDLFSVPETDDLFTIDYLDARHNTLPNTKQYDVIFPQKCFNNMLRPLETEADIKKVSFAYGLKFLVKKKTMRDYCKTELDLKKLASRCVNNSFSINSKMIKRLLYNKIQEYEKPDRQLFLF